MKTSHSRGQCSLPVYEDRESPFFLIGHFSDENTGGKKSIKLLQETSAYLMVWNLLLNQDQNGSCCKQLHRNTGERKREIQCTDLLLAG